MDKNNICENNILRPSEMTTNNSDNNTENLSDNSTIESVEKITFRDSKRKGIIKPLTINSKLEPSCSICNIDKLNASGVCCLCNRVICSYHMTVANNSKYCTICKKHDSYKHIIEANSNHFIKVKNRKKWFCCFT
tara:strand:- start:161 stop:565 length:405 start_codon:yes stop_codon:yes gene_type:complete